MPLGLVCQISTLQRAARKKSVVSDFERESNLVLRNEEILILTTGQEFRGPIRHAEASAEMLGQKHDSGFVLVGVLLGKVLHCIHQQTLAFDVAGVSTALLALTSRGIGQNRDREYFRQERTSRPFN
jgi:hypothetical protein